MSPARRINGGRKAITTGGATMTDLESLQSRYTSWNAGTG
jgi:hypothetical protein